MIKFRAWDKNTERMWDIETWHIADEYVDLIEPGKSIADINAERFWRKQSEIILMQFTGLKDVNGKDIYEGDIVKVWSDMSELTMEPTVNEIVSEDLFGRPGVFLKPAGPHLIEPCLHDSWSNQFEVIGNVHENPELLEADK